jgi:hypothetical protein
MPRIIDLDEKEAQWLEEIAKCKKKFEDSREIVKAETEKMSKAVEEIRKFERYINTAREMYGQETSEPEKIDIPEQKIPQQFMQPSNGNIEGLKLTPAVMKILEDHSDKRFSGSEMTTTLIEKGFKSESPNFRTIVYNTLKRLVKQGKVSVDDSGYEHYYQYKEQNDERLIK